MPPDITSQALPYPDQHSGHGAAAASRTASRPAIQFKGLTYPALRAVLNDTSADSIRRTLVEMLDGDDDRFEWQPVVIDLTQLDAQAPLDWPEVLAALRAVRLHPVAVTGASEEFRDEAVRLQLGWLSPLRDTREPGADHDATPPVPPRPAPAAPQASPPPAPASAQVPASHEAAAEATGADEQPAGPVAASDGAPRTLVIDRPVRSGQRIYARDADLVVIGPVSPGAEIIADGNIHVYGQLQGRAIAGARGHRSATIFTLELRAELVAVCGVYRTFEDGLPEEYRGRPICIELDAVDDKLSLRPLLEHRQGAGA